MLQRFWDFLKSIGHATTVIGWILTAFLLPSKAEQVAEEHPWLPKIINSENALWLLVIVVAIYALYYDLWPRISTLRKGEGREVSVGKELIWFSSQVRPHPSDKKRFFWRNECYIRVYNHGRSGRTARGVRVRILVNDIVISAKNDLGEEEIVLNHGEHIHFLVGFVYSDRPWGTPKYVGGPDNETDMAHKIVSNNRAIFYSEYWRGHAMYGDRDDSQMRQVLAVVGATDQPITTVSFRLPGKIEKGKVSYVAPLLEIKDVIQ